MMRRGNRETVLTPEQYVGSDYMPYLGYTLSRIERPPTPGRYRVPGSTTKWELKPTDAALSAMPSLEALTELEQATYTFPCDVKLEFTHTPSGVSVAAKSPIAKLREVMEATLRKQHPNSFTKGEGDDSVPRVRILDEDPSTILKLAANQAAMDHFATSL